MTNPFFMVAPTQISFSGGRTSAYMLRRILDAHGGTLPDGVVVTFFNTGKEREETLVFVRECGERWKVPIVWLEYRIDECPDAERKHTFAVVDYDTASRNGEPFEQVIRARGYLPNVRMRFCTAELKIRTGERYLKSLGWSKWTCAIGIRSDESHRTGKASATPNTTRRWPLVDAGVVDRDVMDFWTSQPFDLGIHGDKGNCDLCFLKGRKKLAALVANEPDRADWWIAQEKAASLTLGRDTVLATFSRRFSYEELKLHSQGGPMFAGCSWEDDQAEDCFCTD